METPDGKVSTILDTTLCDVLELVPDAVLITDQHGRIVHLNRMAEQLFGYRPGELLGQSLEILVPERYRGRHENLRREYCQDPKPREMGGKWGVARPCNCCDETARRFRWTSACNRGPPRMDN